MISPGLLPFPERLFSHVPEFGGLRLRCLYGILYSPQNYSQRLSIADIVG